MSTKNIFLVLVLGLSVANSYADYENVKIAAQVATVHIIKTRNRLYDFIHSYFWKSDDLEVVRGLEEKLAVRHLNILRARKDINKCLRDNPKSDSRGIPVACEEAGLALACVAGFKELNKIGDDYIAANKKTEA